MPTHEQRERATQKTHPLRHLDKKYIPNVVAERRFNITHKQLPLKPKHVTKDGHISERMPVYANDRIFKETAAILHDYDVTSEEVQEIWECWEKAIIDVVSLPNKQGIRLPLFGSFEPKSNRMESKYKSGFMDILQDFMYQKKQISIRDWDNLPDEVKSKIEEIKDNDPARVLMTPELLTEIIGAIAKDWIQKGYMNGTTEIQSDDV